MARDEYDSLLKADLQQLAERRGLDSSGTAAMIKQRLRDQDADEDDTDTDPETNDADDDFQEDKIEDDEEDEEGEDEEDEEAGAPSMALAEAGDELKDNYFRYTVRAGNDLFFGDQAWHAANEEMAILTAGAAGYRYTASMGRMEYIPDGNIMHYQFPVEKVG